MQLSKPFQSLTWKGYEFLKLLFQPADFFTKLNVVHPAETQMTALRERLGEERLRTSKATLQGDALGVCSGEHRFTRLAMGKLQPLHLRASVGTTWIELLGVGKAEVSLL